MFCMPSTSSLGSELKYSVSRIQGSDLLFGNVVYVFAPAEVVRYCDPNVFGDRNTFKFCVVEDVL